MAPIILFVYNRPKHTKQTLEALSKNKLASLSVLYVYADGPKDNSDEKLLDNIKKVRAIIKSRNWCKKVILIARTSNFGLSQSIISGVTEIINEFGKAIIVEDDLITSKGFLTYMNNALNLYYDVEAVGCVHGWNYNLKKLDYKESTFFLKGGDCWGWATWKKSWDLFSANGYELLNQIRLHQLQHEFNRRNTHNYFNMLKDQVDGKNDSWAIRWHASLFLNDKYCLHPVKSMVKNIGLDGSGTHCNENFLRKQTIAPDIRLKKIAVRDSEWFYKAYDHYISYSSQTWKPLKTLLDQLFRPILTKLF